MTRRTTKWRKGFVQVYTGDGKGKTTAALGLALRAAGAGLKVFIAQFMKKRPAAECRALERFRDLVTIRQYGRDRLITDRPTPEDRAAAARGLDEIRKILHAGDHRVVILDEANVAAWFKLFSVQSLLDIIDAKPPHVELILTGRKADPRIIQRADLVTDMRQVKHYHQQGAPARTGIEA